MLNTGGDHMNIRIKTLWKVPVYCICAGFVSFWLAVHLVARIGVITLSDGSISSNPMVTTPLEVLIFAVALGIGYLVFRTMTKKEIFWSATMIVTILLILQVYQIFMFKIDIAAANAVGMWIIYPTEWCRIIPLVCHYIIPGPWVGAFLCCIAPYIFILFGKKEK